MKKHIKIITVMFFVIFGLTILLNDGFMALDDYFVGITRYIPAQDSSIMTLVHEDDVKSPLQLLPFHALSQSALNLGISSPYMQYRFTLAILSLLNVLLFFWGLRKIYINEKHEVPQEADKYYSFLLAASALYFVMPFALTRPMFETLAAPWLFLSMVYTYLYDRNARSRDLLWAVTFVSVSFCLRQQVGICALAILIFPLLKKRYGDFISSSLLGLGYFLISGIPDYFIRGEYHFSLKAVTLYNFEHGKDYGDQPWYFYLVLILITGFIPFLIAKYPPGFIKAQISKYRVAWIYLILFVGLHNMFPQKWERFLLSIYPILLIALAPFFWHLWQQRNNRKARWISLLGLNLLLLFTASFTRPQNAILELALGLNEHPEITTIYRTEGQPEWFPEAFVARKDYRIEDIPQGATPSSWPVIDCKTWVVINEDQKNNYGDELNSFAMAKYLPSNWIERLSYKLNPKRNQRRASMFAYGCKNP